MNKLFAITLQFCLALLPAHAWSQSSFEKLKTEYQSTDAKLKKHIVEEKWFDGSSESFSSLTQGWQLTGEWLAKEIYNLPQFPLFAFVLAITERRPRIVAAESLT